MHINKNYKIFHLMMPAVLFSAGVIITGKTAVSYYGPFTIIFLRFLTASLVLFPFVKKTYKPFEAKDIFPLAIIGTIGFLLYNFMIVQALRNTSASNISIISALIPITTLGLEVLFFRAKIKKKQLVALALALVSVLILITKGQLFNLFQIIWSKGDLYILLGVCCISVYSIFNSRFNPNYPPMQILLFYFLTTTVLSIPMTLQELPIEFNSFGLLAIFYQGLLGTAITYFLIQLSLKKFGTSGTMIYFNLIPFVALLLAIVILDEPVTSPLVLGSIVMIFSIKLSAI